MFRLSRYRGVALVVAAILLALGLLDLSLTAAVGFTGRFLPNREEPQDESAFTLAGGRISEVLSLPARPGIGTETPLGVVLGLSSMRYAVDFGILAENDGLPLRWLNLGGWGRSINRICAISELLFLSDLRPNTVVICMNPYMLVGHDFGIERAETLKRTGNVIKPWIWVYDNRLVVNHLFRLAWHRAKVALFRWFEFGFPALYPAQRAPFEPEQLSWRRSAVSEKELPQAVDYFLRRGWFDAGRYTPDSSNGRSLVELVRENRARGAKVCIILMPEHSLLRGNTPLQALRCLEAINRANFLGDPVPVYDLRDRIPDPWFGDLDHVGFDARRPISIQVGECLRDFLSGHSAPDRFRAGAGGKAVGSTEMPAAP
ncbi:MAG: hypothetical protein ACLQGP_31490 [Isosphaeraceae bacterium]